MKNKNATAIEIVSKLLLLFSIQIIIITLSADQVRFFHALSHWENKFSYDLIGFCYSYSWSYSFCKRGPSFAWYWSLENSHDSYLCSPLILLYSVSYLFVLYQHLLLLLLCSWFLMLFNRTEMSLSKSTYLLIYLSLETLKFIISTD